MSPLEAIVASTKTAADCIHDADNVGTLERGKLADLLVVEGNPLDDITILQDRAPARDHARWQALQRHDPELTDGPRRLRRAVGDGVRRRRLRGDQPGAGHAGHPPLEPRRIEPRGLFTALGIGLGLCFHTAYSLVGLAVLISQSIVLFNALKLVGAAYLVYVGWRSLRARPGSFALGGAEDDELPRRLTAGGAFTAGLLTNLTNPKVTLFFLALFTQVIEPETSSALKALYGGTIIAISLTWFGFLAIVVAARRCGAGCRQSATGSNAWPGRSSSRSGCASRFRARPGRRRGRVRCGALGFEMFVEG